MSASSSASSSVKKGSARNKKHNTSRRVLAHSLSSSSRAHSSSSFDDVAAGSGSSSEEESGVLANIQDALTSTPVQFHREDYLPMPFVVQMLKAETQTRLDEELDQLRENCALLDQCMLRVVDEYYVGFNRSIRSFSEVLRAIGDAQRMVHSQANDLESSARMLTTEGRADNIHLLWRKTQEYSAIYEMLQKIEEQTLVPERLERFIASRQYLDAAKLLVDSVHTLFGDQLCDIKALVELQEYLLSQKHRLSDLLLEELQSFLYGREPSSVSAPILKPSGVSEAGNVNSFKSGTSSSPGPQSSKLNKNEGDADKLKSATDAAAHNAAASRGGALFVRELVKCLMLLDRVPTAVATLTGRMSTEFRSIIDEAAAAVADRHTKERKARDAAASRTTKSRSSPLVEALHLILERFDAVLRNHIFLVGEFDLVSGADASKLLGSRKNDGHRPVSAVSSYSVAHVWGSLQTEILNFIMMYLNSPMDGSGSDAQDGRRRSSNESSFQRFSASDIPVTSSAADRLSQLPGLDTKSGQLPPAPSLFRDSDSVESSSRRPHANLFRFVDSSAASTTSGLASKQIDQSRLSVLDAMFADIIKGSGGGLWESALIRPSPYNVVEVYPVISRFVQHVRPILSQQQQGQSASTTGVSIGLQSTLDAFIHSTFLEHIREDLGRRLHFALESPESFRPHIPLQPVYDDMMRPVQYCTVWIDNIINELCRNVAVMPQHVGDFLKAIDTAIHNFEMKCRQKISEVLQPAGGDTLCCQLYIDPRRRPLLTTDPLWTNLKSAANVRGTGRSRRRSHGSKPFQLDHDGIATLHLSSSGPLHSSAGSTASSGTSPTEGSHSRQRSQSAAELDAAYEAAEENVDGELYTREYLAEESSKLLLHQQIAFLCNLADSLDWLVSRLRELVSNNIGGSSLSSSAKSQRRKDRTGSSPSPVNLPSSQRDAISKPILKMCQRLEKLSNLCLHNVRTEIRLHCFVFLDGIRRADYAPRQGIEGMEPDPFVVQLNRDLASLEQLLAVLLPPHVCHYLFGRLPFLVCNILVHGLSKIRAINRAGVTRLCRDMFALQQNLASLTSSRESYFDRARSYFEMLLLSEEEILMMKSSDDLTTKFTETQFNRLLEAKKYWKG